MSDSRGLSGALDALRGQGGECFDRVAFYFIEALARRALAQKGRTRELVEGKAEKALADYTARYTQAQAAVRPTVVGDELDRPPTPLAALLEELTPMSLPGAQLRSVRDHRETWARLRVEQTLTQALAAGPSNAGPLNSHALMLQALTLMRDIAPDYLQQFMTYADTLLWLDQAQGLAVPRRKK